MSNPFAPPGQEPEVPETGPEGSSPAASQQGAYGNQVGDQQGASSSSSSPWPIYGQQEASGSQSTPTGQPQYGQSPYGQPSYGQAQQGQPQYGQRSAANQQPLQGQPQYGQQAPYNPPPSSATPYMSTGAPSGPPPSRTGAIWTLVLGAIAMVFVAPAVFFGIMFQGVELSSFTDGSLYAINGEALVVDDSGTVGVSPVSGEVDGCSLIAADATEIPMANDSDTGIWIARNVTPGEYTLQCDGIENGASVVMFSGDVLGALVSSSMAALGWSTVVGVLGLIATIVGIVWLVRRNRARKEYFGPRG